MSTNSTLTPFAQRAIPLAQRSIAAASIGASYTLVGTIFSTGVVQLFIISTLDQNVQVSLDGVADFIPIKANSQVVFDLRSDEISIPGSYGVYVKQIGVPTTGNLYVCGFTL